MWTSDKMQFTEDYAFKHSPESCSDNYCSTDISDEDFMTQLSSDLDIPLLLNPGEDEMAVLNFLVDKTPDEILSDGSPPHNYIVDDNIDIDNLDIKDLDFLNEVLHLPKRILQKTNQLGKRTCKYEASDKLLKPLSPSLIATNEILKNNKSSAEKTIPYFEFLNGAVNLSSQFLDIKSEENSDESCSSRNSLESSTPPPTLAFQNFNSPVFFSANILPKKEIVNSVDSTNVHVVPQSEKCVNAPIKRVPIKPKAPYTVPVKNSKLVVIKNIKNDFPNNNSKHNKVISSNNMSSNIVVLDRIPVNSFNTITSSAIAPTISHLNNSLTMQSISVNPSRNTGVDPRILKRQERRIKNRESASVSRKKKKDYLTSLEEQVKDLTIQNKRLIDENTSLRERLSLYEEDANYHLHKISPKVAKPALVLCVFLFVVGLNLNLMSSPFFLKSSKVNPEGRDYPKLSNHYGRNLLWAPEVNVNEKNNTYFSPLTMCPASINQTESARLLLELERWIGKPDRVKKVTPVKSSTQKSKARRKNMRIDLSLTQVNKQQRYGPENEFRNEIQLFNPKADQLYSEFFDAINRQYDTFYVVSFSEQHMLLPALYHNKTRRPKMSLLMPSVFPNETSNQTYIPLMQIDCEVLDTKLVNVKFGSIPRPHRHYGNFTNGSEASKTRTYNTTSSRKSVSKKNYKPYFLDKTAFKPVEFN